MRVLCLCVYSFLICCLPFRVFGTHFAFLGVTLGCLLGAIGSPWAPKGLSLASLWLPFASLGMPVGPLGPPWAPQDAWDDFGSKMDVRFSHCLERLRCLRIESGLVEFSFGKPRISPKWRKGRSSQPHFSRRGLD